MVPSDAVWSHIGHTNTSCESFRSCVIVIAGASVCRVFSIVFVLTVSGVVQPAFGSVSCTVLGIVSHVFVVCEGDISLSKTFGFV